jgi:release factor glutamine methyltransferase
MTIHERVAEARQRLRAAGIPPQEADLDARVLAEHLLGWDTARVLASAGQTEPPGFADRFGTLVARRAAREPLAYIVGHREFWSLDFEVTPAVLVPRPETELIVEIALELFPSSRPAAPAVADLCTGCGCLAVAIAIERPAARLIAADVSPAALDVARRNAVRLGVGDRVRFAVADLFTPQPLSQPRDARASHSADLDGPWDLIVANPPYVPARDRASLQPEVGRHEPEIALFGGDDGLAVIRRLVHETPAHLRSGGRLVFEFGYGQASDVERIVSSSPNLGLIELRRDLQGVPRTAVAARR